MNEPSHARILIESGELMEQPSKYKGLAAQGIMEYKVSSLIMRNIEGKRRECGVKSTSELKSEEASEVRESIQSAVVTHDDGPRRVVKKNVKKKDDAPEAAALKKANSRFQAALRALKKASDRVAQDLIKASTDLPQLEQKGYPKLMREFMEQKVAEVQEKVTDANSVYAKYIFEPASTDPDKRGEIEEKRTEIECAMKQLTTSKAEFDKNVGADIRTLTSK